jgi:hypothetical protein
MIIIILLLLLLLFYYFIIIIIIISIIIIHILTILINNCQMIFSLFRIVKNIILLSLFQKYSILSLSKIIILSKIFLNLQNRPFVCNTFLYLHA